MIKFQFDAIDATGEVLHSEVWEMDSYIAAKSFGFSVRNSLRKDGINVTWKAI